MDRVVPSFPDEIGAPNTDGIQVGINHGVRFKVYCIWCKNHSFWGACVHEIKTINDPIECSFYDFAGGLM